ncbi:hypothetical protein C7M84_013175 [Penaeus vannamei]|uniref:Uncharacterized protein n=1 Tax=Penaeus vannamei TaxID=6689 RepID=A0A3R7PJL6_PENVA|nr:hypothetical protein C7M84_013175 [Penaeus vannamei]
MGRIRNLSLGDIPDPLQHAPPLYHSGPTDIIYNNHLTELFFKTVLRLMSEPPNKTLYVAQEKRYVFSFAFCYDYFLDRIEWLRSQNTSTINWTTEEVPIDFKQYFNYEKSQNLVLWKISAELK